jgi:predicted dehydrogenase
MSASPSTAPIGVGIVGASTTGWSQAVHVPALKALDGFALRAVATSRAASAEAAAQALGVATGYGDYRELIADPSVDLVMVSVRVPLHAEILGAAIEAGKAVFSEWPLAVDHAQASALATLASERGVRTAVGLQGRFQAVVRHVRDLIDDGYVGDVMATTFNASGRGWGPVTAPGREYMFDDANGASALAVTGIHGLDAVFATLGEPTELRAELAVGRRTVTVAGDGTSETLPVTAPDQIAIAGRLGEDTILSCFIRGGASRGENLRWEVNGTEGDLVVSCGDGNGNLQNAQLTLAGGRGDDAALTPLPLPARYDDDVPAALTPPQRTYARLFEHLAQDWHDGGERVPGFSHAVRRHAMIDGLRRGRWSAEDVRAPEPSHH